MSFRSVVVAVSLLAVVIGSGALFGYASEGWDDFNWEVAALAGTAVGTTLLAAFTGRLANETRSVAALAREELAAAQRQADASQAAAAAAHASVAASNRPLLIDVATLPRWQGATDTVEGVKAAEQRKATSVRVQELSSDDDAYLVCEVPLRNVGPGVAIVQSVGLRVSGQPDWNGSASRTVIPTGEMTRTSLTLGRKPLHAKLVADAILQGHNFSVEVKYTDAGGEQVMMSRLDVYHSEGRRWAVSQVHLCDPETKEAYVTSAAAS